MVLTIVNGVVDIVFYVSFFLGGIHEVFFDHFDNMSSRKTALRLRIELPTNLFGLGTSPLSSGSLGSSRISVADVDNVTYL